MGVGPEGYLWKPRGENTGTGTVITPEQYEGQIDNVALVDQQGNNIETGSYRSPYEHGGGIWNFEKPGGSYGDNTQVAVTLDSGEVVYYGGGGAGRYEGGPREQGDPGNDQYVPPGAHGGGSTGVAANPFYLEGFPGHIPVDFPTIEAAPFNFTDPKKFAEEFGTFNRGEVRKNYDLSKELALESLDAELAGLKSFVPAAAALKRQQTALDNVFNQEQRTAQIRKTLPNAEGDLAAQRKRALAYAEGRLPDEALDRARELRLRSGAADAASFSGIGPRSGAADNLSELMSADARFQISQYGEGLFGQNLQAQANLLLAPTEYSNAGTEVRVNPEVGAGRLALQATSMLNEATLVSPGQALSSNIQQEQFRTQLEQRTREYNSTGIYDASKFNSTGAFNAALGAFQYNVAYLNALQSANQANLNMATGVNFQGMQNESFNQGLTQAQQSQTTSDVIRGVGALPAAMNAVNSVLSSTPMPDPEPTPTPKAAPLTGEGFSTAPSPAAASRPVSFDAASPSTMKFSQGAELPPGYARVSSNSDGTTSAASIQGYSGELERFAKANNVNRGSVSIRSAALADRAVSNATGISYVPLPGFQPIATSFRGDPVYAMPAAAASGNSGVGRDNLDSFARTLATLGVTDPSVYETLGSVAGFASDREFLSSIDEISAEKGSVAAAKAITNKVFGDKSPDPTTPDGQQALFMADKISQLWPNLSPQQKSSALASLSGPALKSKTGKDIANEIVPGTERSVAGGLRIRDAINLTFQGLNGHALARNWGQLSSIANIASGTRASGPTARLASDAGLLGYGIQGAAVPVEQGYLRRMGAKPAPELGVGAVNFDQVGHVPKNYTIISQTPKGGVVAAPTNLIHTSPLKGAGPTPLAYKKAVLVSQNRHPAQKLWKAGATNKVIRGADGGSAIVSGLKLMEQSNPALLSAIVASSLFSSTMGSG